MRAWPSPVVSRTCSTLGTAPAAVVCTTRGPDGSRRPRPGEAARLYVCGITPYDATHLGHAATYVAFDLPYRAWREAGHAVHYVQNVTDVDDPLLERAAATGEDWRDLAERETQLFREDMAALSVLPPDALRRGGRVDRPGGRADRAAAGHGRGVRRRRRPLLLGDGRSDVRRGVGAGPRRDAARCSPSAAATRTGRASATRSTACSGSDSDRASRRGTTELGPGRPGWHVECAAIAHRPPRR